MKLITKLTGFALLLLLLLFSDAQQAQAQFGGGRKGSLKIMKGLPTFFVNDNVLPDYLKKIYKQDATRLALRLINKEQRLSKQTIKVPDELVQAIYNALVAVRVSDYGAIDTIAKTYNVRTFPVPNVNFITLLAEHDAGWIQPLKRGSDSTGNVGINRVIRQHNLVMTKMVYLDEERLGLVLQSLDPINIPALARQFFIGLGIGSIEETLPFGDGNDIQITRVKDGWDIEYSVRFGGCLNQCKKRRDWYFHVTNGGQVEYKGTQGHTIPPWIEQSTAKVRRPDVLKRK